MPHVVFFYVTSIFLSSTAAIPFVARGAKKMDICDG
jgi:hypothetical protein